MLAEYRLKQGELELERAEAAAASTPSRRRRSTACTIELHANIELPGDLAQTLENGATGIGLFRSEFLFLNREGLPTEDEQFEAYRSVAEGMEGKPVTIRTFDLGADKAGRRAGRTRARRAEPGARPARGPLLPRRAAAVPHAAARDPARVALRQGEDPDADARRRVGEIDQTLALIAQAKETLREQGVPFDSGVPRSAA